MSFQLVRLFIVAAVMFAATTGANTPIEISNVDFFWSVAQPKEPKSLLLLWYSRSCQTCAEILRTSYKQLAAHVARHGRDSRARFMVAKMSVDSFPQLARAQGVDVLPTIQLYSYQRRSPLLVDVEPSFENLLRIAEDELQRLKNGDL